MKIGLERPKNFILIFCCILLCHTASILAQVDVSFKETPSKYVIPNKEMSYKIDDSFLSGDRWVVYSDRQYNKTYDKPNGGNVKMIIDFLTKFYVFDKKGDYLNIYNATKNDEGEYVDYGWIHMDNLLLWNHCLVNENNINLKVILGRENENLSLFSPESSSPEINFDIFYVYKIQDNSILIGRQPRFLNYENGVENCIITYVKEDDIWIWEDVVAIEPNLCDMNSEGQKCKPELLGIYSDQKSSRKFLSDFSYEKNRLLKVSRAKEEWESTIFRFPVVETKDNYAEVVLLQGVNIAEVKMDKMITAYASLSNESNEIDYFVLKHLLSAEEISGISLLLGNLLEDEGGLSERKNIYNNWLRQIEGEFYNKTKEEILELPMTFIHKYFFTSELTILPRKLKFHELLDETIVSDQLISDYLFSLHSSYMEFKSLLNSKDNSNQFLTNDVLYYWINSYSLP